MLINYSGNKKVIFDDAKEPIVVLTGVIKESLELLKYSVFNNLGKIGTVFQIFIPHICMIGFYSTGYHFIWIILPFIMYYVSYIIKRMNMVYNNRTVDNIPIPDRRFTETDEDGEVLIDSTRLQELLLYMDELEDVLEGMGKM